jgi:hypothetical protein
MRLYLLFLPILLWSDSSIYSALKGGRVEGEAKLFSYDIDKPSPNNAYANAIGGYIKYRTDTTMPIYGAIRVDTSLPIGGRTNPEKTALFNNDKDASGLIVNSEAYLALNGSNRVLKVGNLRLNTPMMNDDTTRIVPWSYRGVAYTGEAVEDFKLQLLHIIDIRSHTSHKYTKESASGDIGDGVSMVGLHYSGIDDLDMHGYYYYAPELYSTIVLQADYRYNVDDDTLLCASLQYFGSGNGGRYVTTDNKNGGDDIDLVAIRVGYMDEDLSISLNYSQNFGISGIIKGYGGLAKVHTTSMIANGRGNYKPTTWMVKMLYDLPPTPIGKSELGFNYTVTRVDDPRGSEFDAYYLHLRHEFDKHNSIFIRYESFDYLDDREDESYFRVIASYRY